MLDCLSRPDRFVREEAIVRHIERLVDVNRERILSLPSRERCDLFETENERFADFAHRIGVRVLPANGHTVAFFVLDLFDRGASRDEIETAVEAIHYMHQMTHCYLDWLPIHAALEFVKAQS
jgi:hypothetical protein